MNLARQRDVSSRQRAQRPIEPLPPDVVAQIKSSTHITSLATVILGLVENALDADASRVEVTLDARRGGCVVEDDGVGILPSEFREDGGLGKPYCKPPSLSEIIARSYQTDTSKHDSPDPVHGRFGTFLASLGALSLLTITSHHCLHRSHNTVTLHRSQVIARQTPAPQQQHLSFRDHGTRVTVRDLFGSMPVRVKQRAMAVDDRGEQERQWEALKKLATGLLLAWKCAVSLRIRDSENNRALLIHANRQQPFSLGEKLPDGRGKVHAQLRPLLSTLSQAFYITPDEWSSWVPASASTSSISVKGAISLNPAPSKSVQFISIGIKPVFSDEGHNELFDEVNRLFNHSSFGIVDDELELDEKDKERRMNDKRYKTDGPTNKQLRGGKKGIDRWPMFCLHINIADANNSDDVLSSEPRLHSITEVMRAMITQWLQVHQFRPRARQSRPQGSRPESVSSRTSTPSSLDPGNPQSHLSQDDSAPTDRQRAESFASSKAQKRKRKSSFSTKAAHDADHGDQTISSDWSKIRSGKSSFYDSIWKSKKPFLASSQNQSNSQTAAATVSQPGSARAWSGEAGIASTFFQTDPVMPGELGSLQPSSGESTPYTNLPTSEQQGEIAEADLESSEEPSQDATLKWIDPLTKETYHVNSRTGIVVEKEEKQTKSVPSASQRAPASISTTFHKPLRLSRRPESAPDNSAAKKWLEDFLADWDNPVFRPQPSAIPQISLQGLSNESDRLLHGRNGHCSHGALKEAFAEASSFGKSRLSKDGLKESRVVAQVDKKFILAVMEARSPADVIAQDCDAGRSKQMLVIIDQHAADERCRIEELFVELCSPKSAQETECRSSLGHTSRIKTSVIENAMYFEISAQEARLLHTYAEAFAGWGILYDLNKSGSRHILSVRTLPSGIAERCQGDPKLLLTLLRSEAWRLAEDRTLAAGRRTNTPDAADNASINTTEPHSWLSRIGTCPQGILELLNSRACRSAIMFNDELSVSQCEELIARLARCAFPFQCAHGRPSMVPLVDMGPKVDQGDDGDGDGAGGLGGFGELAEHGKGAQKSGFAESFKRWRERESMHA